MIKNKLLTLIVSASALTAAASGVPAWADSFSYGDQNKWNVACGYSQSPVAIKSADAVSMVESGNIRLNYNNQVLRTDDNSHTIQVDTTGTASIDGRLFNLAQFHFHSPSEHTLNEKSYPLEVHFVHKAQNGRLAVLGVFFDEGKENSAFQSVLDSIKKGQTNNNAGTIDISGLFPQNKSYYHYLGSLTTPPLSENVEWYVLKQPIEVSAKQIAAFNRYYKGNNRAVQPLNKRPLLAHTE